jgi:hypothetical protein
MITTRERNNATRTTKRRKKMNANKITQSNNNAIDIIDAIVDAMIIDATINNVIDIIDVANTTFAHDAIAHNDETNDEHVYMIV